MGESLDDSLSESPRRWKCECETWPYKHTSFFKKIVKY
jgi:hypothetical protein